APEPSLLVRRDIHPRILLDQLVVKLNLSREDISRLNNVEQADDDISFYDDGHIFVNEEDDFILSYEESNDSDNEFDDLDYDDDDVASSIILFVQLILLSIYSLLDVK
ncbi:hypothetical protein TorRG33x02_204320, partial [Trema orientale]